MHNDALMGEYDNGTVITKMGKCGSDPVFKIFGPDPDSTLDHMCQYWCLVLIKLMN